MFRVFLRFSSIIGGIALCFRLWTSKAAPYMQALDLIFGIGCLLSPVVTEALLKLSQNSSPDSIHSNTSVILQDIKNISAYQQSTIVSPTKADLLNKTCDNIGDKAQENHLFWLAFVIFGSVTILTAIPYFINTITKVQLYTPKDRTIQPTEKSKEEKRFMIKILVLLAIFSFTYNAVEDLTGGLIKNFVVNYLCWTESKANILLTIFWATYTVSRIIGIVEVIFLHPGTVVIVHFILLTISFYLMLLVNSYENIMWVCAALMAAGISPIFSNRISWTDRYVKMTGKVMGFIFVMEGIGSMVWPPIVGILIDTYGEMCFIYMLCTLGTFTLLLFIIMHIIAEKRGSRYETTASEKTLTNINVDAELEHLNK